MQVVSPTRVRDTNCVACESLHSSCDSFSRLPSIFFLKIAFWGLRELRRTLRSSHSCLSRWRAESDVRGESRVAAHWSSWADCVHMIKQRHPEVAETLIMGIHRDLSPCCQGLLEGAGLDVPSWRSLADTPPAEARMAAPGLPDAWKNDTSGDRCGPPCQTLAARW